MRHIVNDTIVVEYQPASAKRVPSAARSFSSTSERTIFPPRSVVGRGRALQLGEAALHVVAAVEQREPTPNSAPVVRIAMTRTMPIRRPASSSL